LHEHPDLDCLASSYLAIALLTSGSFPDGSQSLACYVDAVDQGYRGMSLRKPFSLYSACLVLGHRLAPASLDDTRRHVARSGPSALRVVEYVVQQAASGRNPSSTSMPSRALASLVRRIAAK